MGRRNRSRRLDAAAVSRVRAAAQRDPGSPTAVTGFAARALAAQPKVPAWIWWLYQNAGEELARMEYQMNYPLDHTGHRDRRTTAEWLIASRARKAECSARAVERARRFYADQPCIVYAHAPDLPDDEEFYAALESGQEWTGHWFSRDSAEEWGLSLASDSTAV